MRRVSFIAGIGLGLALTVGTAGAQEAHAGDAGEEAHAQEEGGHGGLKNEVAIFLGNTRKSNHDAFTVGLDYARALGARFGLGAFFDYASSGSERDYILGGGLWVEVIEHGAVLLGGGVEREEFSGSEGAHGAAEGEPHGDKTVGLIRVGATYAFHFGSEGRWGLAPQAFLDITEGNDAWVLGVALGYTF